MTWAKQDGEMEHEGHVGRPARDLVSMLCELTGGLPLYVLPVGLYFCLHYHYMKLS